MAASSPVGRRVARPPPTSPEVAAQGARLRAGGAARGRAAGAGPRPAATAPAVRRRTARPARPSRSRAPGRTTASVPSSTTAAARRGAVPRTPPGRPSRRHARTGQQASAPNATEAEAVCATDDPAAGRGFAATRSVATPPTARTARPGTATGRSAAAVTPWQRPTPSRATVITHRCGASTAASSLIVRRTGSYASGRSAAATDQPPTSSRGASRADRTPQRGTVVMGVTLGASGRRLGACRTGRSARSEARAGPAGLRGGAVQDRQVCGVGGQGVAGEVSAEPDRAAGSSRLGMRRSARDSPRPTRTRTSESTTTGGQPPAPQAVPATPPNTDDPR